MKSEGNTHVCLIIDTYVNWEGSTIFAAIAIAGVAVAAVDATDADADGFIIIFFFALLLPFCVLSTYLC